MQFSTVLVALLATSAFAAPAPVAAGNAPAPKPQTGKPTKPNDPADPTSQDPTVHDNTVTDPGSETPTDPGSETPTTPGETETEPEPSGTGEPAPETSGTTAPSCSTKRDLSNLFGLLRRACDGDNIVMPPGQQGPKDPADIPPYKAPSPAEMKQYMTDIANYQFGKVNDPVSQRLRAINTRYINRIPGDGDVQLYAGDGKDGAMVQTEQGNRLNVGQAYHDYNEGFFDPAQEPAKSIMATNDPKIIQNFFASTSADFVLAANIPQKNGEPTGTAVLSTSFSNDQLATMTGAKGYPLIFTSDESPAALANPGIRFMTRADPKVAETFLPDTAPALAVVADPSLASANPDDLAAGWRRGADGKTIYRKMADGWMPVTVMFDKLGVYGPKSWP